MRECSVANVTTVTLVDIYNFVNSFFLKPIFPPKGSLS